MQTIGSSTRRCKADTKHHHLRIASPQARFRRVAQRIKGGLAHGVHELRRFRGHKWSMETPFIKVRGVVGRIFLPQRDRVKSLDLNVASQNKTLVGQEKIYPVDAMSALPIDPDVTIGKLDNGLTYYIQPCTSPTKGVAALWLVAKAGFAHESPSQKGIAHFIEHVAAAETAHFEFGAINDYLSSIGCKEGPDNNAETGFDRTVYRLSIPLEESGKNLDRALFILSDIAGRAKFPEKAINHERGPLLQEMQRGKNVMQRFFSKVMTHLFGAGFADAALPSDHAAFIQSLNHKDLTNFYQKWYRPDNLALIAVGDIKPQQLSHLVRKHFASLVSRVGPQGTLSTPPVPKEDQYLCFADTEATFSKVAVHYTLEEKPATGTLTQRQAKDNALSWLAQEMINARLFELTKQDKTALMAAQLTKSRPIRGAHVITLEALHKEKLPLEALKELLSEVRRIRSHGFLDAELKRAKAKRAGKLEHLENNRDRWTIEALTERYAAHFVEGEPIPSIDAYVKTQKEILSELSLEEINQFVDRWLPDQGRLITSFAPKKKGQRPLKDWQLRKAMQELENSCSVPYSQSGAVSPLLRETPKAGQVVSKKRFDKIGVTRLELDNGMTVFIKPTPFDNDTVLIHSFSQSGLSDATPDERISAQIANIVAAESGLGGLSPKDLSIALADKQVAWTREIKEYLTTFTAKSAKKDLETAMQLMHLSFSNPGYNQNGYMKALEHTQEILANEDADPNHVFVKAILSHTSNGHPSTRPADLSELTQADYEKSCAFHQRCFCNADDSTVVIVGNIEDKSVLPLIEKYCASIPAAPTEKPANRYPPLTFPDGVSHHNVFAGKEPAVTTFIAFPSKLSSDLFARFQSNMTCRLLEKRLIQALREQKGKVYSISVRLAPPAVPQISQGQTNIIFSCDPDDVELLEEEIKKQIFRFQAEGPKMAELEAFKQSERHFRQKALSNNLSWISLLSQYSLMNWDLNKIADFEKNLNGLTPNLIGQAAGHLFDLDHFSSITLYPKELESSLMSSYSISSFSSNSSM